MKTDVAQGDQPEAGFNFPGGALPQPFSPSQPNTEPSSSHQWHSGNTLSSGEQNNNCLSLDKAKKTSVPNYPVNPNFLW